MFAIDHIGTEVPAAQKRLGVLPAEWPVSTPGPMGLGSGRLCNDRPYQDSEDAALMVSLESQRATIYVQHPPKARTQLQLRQQAEHLTRGDFNGYVSPATARRLRKVLGTWLGSVWLYRKRYKPKWAPGRAYPVFLTLTLPAPQQHDDRELHRRALMPYIQRLRRSYGIENYFWRAEAQENGNLHYHLLIDRFVAKELLTADWNRTLAPLGYIQRFAETNGHPDPPSTEVHRIKEKIRDKTTGKWRPVDPVAYLLGYLLEVPAVEPPAPGEEPDPNTPRRLRGTYTNAKGEHLHYYTRSVSGRVWGMADALRDIREPRGVASRHVVWALYEATRRGMLRRFDCDRATLFFGHIGQALDRFGNRTASAVRGYLLNVFANLYPNQLAAEFLQRHPPRSPLGLLIDFGGHRLTYAADTPGASPAFGSAEELAQWARKHRPEAFNSFT